MSEALGRFAAGILHEARLALLDEDAAEAARALRRARLARTRAVKRAFAMAAKEQALREEIETLRAQSLAAAWPGSLDAIDRLIEFETGLTLAALRGKSRARRLARPRQLGMWLARMTTSASYPAIARHWHRSDHTTALHAYREVGQWTGDEAALRERLLAELKAAAQAVRNGETS